MNVSSSVDEFIHSLKMNKMLLVDVFCMYVDKSPMSMNGNSDVKYTIEFYAVNNHTMPHFDGVNIICKMFISNMLYYIG